MAYATRELRPGMNPAVSALQSQQYRDQGDARARTAQQQIRDDELQNNQLVAQRYALGESARLQADPSNPRTVNDTSMSISNGGMASGSASGSTRRTPSGLSGAGAGGFVMPPALDGKYMPLVNMPEFNPTAGNPLPPQVSMGAGDFTPEDATGYQNAAFARLKDKSGQLGRSAVDSLAAELAGRGISGESGTFGRGLADRVSQSVQPLADLNVAHLGEEYQAANRSRQMSENARLAQYSGNINQRNQDMSTQLAIDQLKSALAQQQYSGGIQQRGQDLETLYRMGLI